MFALDQTGYYRGASSEARKENTQCVLYSDPGQRVLYAFFTRFYVILRLFLLTHCARFLLRSATTFFTAFFTRFFKRVFSFLDPEQAHDATPVANNTARLNLSQYAIGPEKRERDVRHATLLGWRRHICALLAFDAGSPTGPVFWPLAL